MPHALVYAVGVAVSPVPIATVIVILGSSRASTNAVSFVGGWILGVAGAAVLMTLVVDELGVHDSRPLWIVISEIAVGAGFLTFGARLLLRPNHEQPLPGWLDRFDRLTPGRAATLAIALSGANPKVLALALGSALSLAQTTADGTTEPLAIALFVAIGASGVIVPTAAYLAFPAQGTVWLVRFRGWLVRHERPVLVGLAVAIGGLFVRDGLRSLIF